MKKQWYYFLMIAIAALFITSCDDDDDSPVVIDVPIYGFQLSGTATGGDAYIIDQAQMVDDLDYKKAVQNGMNYGIYYLSAGDVSFKNVTVDAVVEYGVANVAETSQADESTEEWSYKSGDLIADGSASFSVSTAGLYYIITDEVALKFFMIPINNLEINASEDKAVIDAGASATGATFSIDGVDLRAKFKVRINTAWKLITTIAYDATSDNPEEFAKPVISFGGALDALTFEGGDIEVDNGGNTLNFTFTWNPANKGIAGITCATETGEPLVEVDYSAYNMGFIGNAVWADDAEFGWGDVSYENQLPVKDGSIYTWTWSSVTLADTVGGRTWKFREGNAWNFTVGYNDVTLAGSSAADFLKASDDGNFGVAAQKTYDFILVVDASDDSWTLTAVEAGGATYDMWGIIGDATPGGWDADTNLTPNADGTEWTWTGDLVAGQYKFRANDLWVSQIGDDGAGGAAFSDNATGWVIADADAGNYTIVLDSETPAVTITKN